MGLDNGLTVKAKTTKGMEYLKEQPYMKKEYYSSTRYELGYWRKCWNIRSAILGAFTDKGYDGQGGSFELTSVEDLLDFMETLKLFLNEKAWDATDNGSIWTWYEALPRLADAIRNIKFLIDDIEYGDVSFEDLRIEFYDSY